MINFNERTFFFHFQRKPLWLFVRAFGVSFHAKNWKADGLTFSQRNVNKGLKIGPWWIAVWLPGHS